MDLIAPFITTVSSYFISSFLPRRIFDFSLCNVTYTKGWTLISQYEQGKGMSYALRVFG